MTKPRISMLIAAAGLAWCAGASAQVLSRSDYQAREQAIVGRYRSALAACTKSDGHRRDVCLAEAEAEDRIARSDLEAHYRPSAKARHHALLVAAESRHAVAQVRCEDRKDAARTTCLAAAAATRTVARDKAGAQLKAAQARASATEQSAGRREDPSSEAAAARYATARQQCDGYVDKLRELCLAQTRKHFIKRP